jgi:hypothetical protein
VLLFLTAAAGCDSGKLKDADGKGQPVSKLTGDNYLRVKEGMQEDEVKVILGTPSETQNVYLPKVAFVLTWKEGDKLVRVRFEDFKVSSKDSLGLH